jgi:protoporphyrinogen oxidase
MEKAIIMGAGPAGLTAAYELLTKTNIKPVIIESDKQVGGLSKTINYKGNLIDIGGHRFFSKSQVITDWWLQFLPLDKSSGNASLPISYQNQTASIKSPAFQSFEGNGSMLVRPRKSRIYYNHALFDYPLSLNTKTMRNFGLRKLSRIAASYARVKMFPLKEETNLEEFFINRFGYELYDSFFKGYTEKVWGVDCKDIPADWGYQRIKDLSIGKAIWQSIASPFRKNESLTQKGISTSLIEQFLYPEKGPGQMWEAVARKVTELGGELRLENSIEQIVALDQHRIGSVGVRDHRSGVLSEIAAEYFFSTIPVQQLINNLQKIVVPEPVKEVAAALKYRDFMIVGLLFKKDSSAKTGLLPELKDNWIYLQDKTLKAGRLQIFNNWSPFMVKDAGTLWVGLEYFCQTTDAIWTMEPADMIRLAVEEISKTGLIAAEKLLDATVIKVPKAYPSYIGSYEQFSVIQEFVDGIDNLFLVGRNGMHRYNNTDHSMMTAMTAVENIIAHQRSRSNIWAVNMEKDFHEEGKQQH